jgi:hypothetical protein
MVRGVLGVLLFLAAPVVLAAVEVDSVLVPDTVGRKVEVRALRLADRSGVEPLAVLQEASVAARERLEAVAAWNRAGRRPMKDGFARPLPVPQPVRFTGDLLVRQPGRLAGGALLLPPSGGLVWGSEVQVEGAYRLRLHLSDVRLPRGTRMWVYGEDGEEVAFEAEQVTHGGEIWTPSVGGPVIRMEVQLPEGEVEGSGFTVDQVLEQLALDADGALRLDGPSPKEDTSCLMNAACFGTEVLPAMDLYKKAVAHLRYVEGGNSFICSGALMNDADTSTFIPYFLTANHCFSTQAVASTLEAFFDFILQGCPGSVPSLGSRPRTVGATLLATSASTDFTLVRLSSLPAGRGLLGWTSETVPVGAVLYRLSHPSGFPMAFSTTSVISTGPTCGGVPRPRFLYSEAELGGTLGGSSGAPVVRSDGRVVGQLLGGCGPSPEGCDPRNSTIDGAFSQTFPSVGQFLNTNTTPGVCTPGPSTLCLGSGGRFKVEATFDTGSQQGQAQVVKLTDETGYLWFFNSANVEAVVKVLNACGLNNNFWVFAGGLTDVQTQITVTDTKTGAAKTYTNPRGTPFQPIQDTSALATCP